jgi:hypothetical protein
VFVRNAIAVTVVVRFGCGRIFGVGAEGKAGEPDTGGSPKGSSGNVGISGPSAISEPSTRGVEIAGSVPRNIYSNGVGLGVIGTGGGELRDRPMSKATMIPMIEMPPITIGMMRSRLKEGWLSIRRIYCKLCRFR